MPTSQAVLRIRTLPSTLADFPCARTGVTTLPPHT
jgi:hypothetical protein